MRFINLQEKLENEIAKFPNENVDFGSQYASEFIQNWNWRSSIQSEVLSTFFLLRFSNELLFKMLFPLKLCLKKRKKKNQKWNFAIFIGIINYRKT